MISPKHQQLSCPSSQTGFTIIESLVAILVLGILLVALAPVIVLATATRVQARRVELATQAARSYIDGLSAGTIISSTPGFPTYAPNLSQSAPPTSNAGLYCLNADTPTASTCNPKDPKTFYVQGLRDVPDPFNSTTTTVGYHLAVRVYRADADFGSLTTSKQGSTTALTFTGGLGNRRAPLVEMTTEISPPKAPTYTDYCHRIAGGCH